MYYNNMITAHFRTDKAAIIIVTFPSIYGKGRMPVLPVMAMAEPLTLWFNLALWRRRAAPPNQG